MSGGKFRKPPKQSYAKGLTEIVDTIKKFTAEWSGKISGFSAEWAKKHNALAEQFDELKKRLGAVMGATAQEFGKIWANETSLNNSLVAHDNSILALDKNLLEVFGHLTQFEKRLEQLTPADGYPAIDTEILKTEAKKWYHDITVASFNAVHLERAVREKKEKEEAEAKAAAQQAEIEAAKAKKEAESVTAELRQAEGNNAVSTEGGPGCEIPKGAQVFGG